MKVLKGIYNTLLKRIRHIENCKFQNYNFTEYELVRYFLKTMIFLCENLEAIDIRIYILCNHLSLFIHKYKYIHVKKCVL